MPRYISTLSIKYGTRTDYPGQPNEQVVNYFESSPEQDKMDAEIGEGGGSGYLELWETSTKAYEVLRKLMPARNAYKSLISKGLPTTTVTIVLYIYDNFYDNEMKRLEETVDVYDIDGFFKELQSNEYAQCGICPLAL